MRIACVHQGFELYGSDRSFASAVDAIRNTPSADVKVILPRPGPIDTLFAHIADRVEHRDLLVLRKADIVRRLSVELPSSIRAIFSARRTVAANDVTYVNTCVILDFLIAGFLTRRRMIVHVREIPVGRLMQGLRRLLILSGASLIYNSEATKKAFAIPESVPQAVVWNSFPDPGAIAKDATDNERRLRILCIGRINGWKGQDDLVAACGLLAPEDRQKLEIRIVGSVYEDQHQFLDRLVDGIKQNDLGAVVTILPFTPDPATHYRWADIVIVPSKTPEPFGRVAIEAMAYGCAVIGTAQGGLTEIVVDGETGLLVPPAAPKDIAAALMTALAEPARVRRWGTEGRSRFLTHFTETAVSRKLVETFSRLAGAAS